MNFNVVITGVGGQGNVLVSRILAKAAMKAGFQVRTSEAIGMAQREGMVMSQVRIGDEIYSPLIPDGQGDVLLGFELAEAVRGLPKLKKSGVIIANTTTIIPVSAALGLSQYPVEDLQNYMQRNYKNLYMFNATELAQKAGTVKATNIVLLGALSKLKLLPFAHETLLSTIKESVPEKFLNINLTAFQLGFNALEVN